MHHELHVLKQTILCLDIWCMCMCSIWPWIYYTVKTVDLHSIPLSKTVLLGQHFLPASPLVSGYQATTDLVFLSLCTNLHFLEFYANGVRRMHLSFFPFVRTDQILPDSFTELHAPSSFVLFLSCRPTVWLLTYFVYLLRHEHEGWSWLAGVSPLMNLRV